MLMSLYTGSIALRGLADTTQATAGFKSVNFVTVVYVIRGNESDSVENGRVLSFFLPTRRYAPWRGDSYGPV